MFWLYFVLPLNFWLDIQKIDDIQKNHVQIYDAFNNALPHIGGKIKRKQSMSYV